MLQFNQTKFNVNFPTNFLVLYFTRQLNNWSYSYNMRHEMSVHFDFVKVLEITRF